MVVGRPYANTIIPSSARILRWPNSFDARAVTERWEQGGGDMACASVKEMRRHGGRRKSVLATGSTRRFREHAGKEGALDAWTWARIVSDHLPVEIQLDLERTK